MENLREMLQNQNYEKIWKSYLGFLDLDIDEFMTIQKRLLHEQIELLNNSKLGQKLFGNQNIKTLDDFRTKVRLTTYDDYAETLLSKKSEDLPSKPLHWVQTTWKGGTDSIKLAPYSENMVIENTKMFLASLILSTSTSRKEFKLRNNDKFLYGMAPRPYLTGYAPYILKHEVDFKYFPEKVAAEKMSFKERNVEGFKLSIQHGADLFYGVSSVLVKIGESFSNSASNSKMIWPKNFIQARRLLKAFYKKRFKNQQLLPKDLFVFKGIVCGGTDSATYKKRIEELYGVTPLEIFGGTESAGVATETWSRNGLTFFPDVNFLEFIPMSEIKKETETVGYQPKTLLLDEIVPGETYELVITKLRGGAFVRYRIGDLMKCIALENKEDEVKLPQVIYLDRVQNIIDLAGFTRLTKQNLSDSIKLSQLDINHFVARKEYVNDQPIIHLYVESTEQSEKIHDIINKQLRQIDTDYHDVGEMLGYDPLKVTVIETGSFDRFKEKNGYLPSTMNPSDEVINSLLS